jgi:putative ABC transport system ATP-binding protein
MSLRAAAIGRRRAGDGGWLFRDVDIDVQPGERLGILGSSGAGKTVILRALALLDPLDEGAILWNDRPIHGDAVPEFRAQVVYLHQRPTLVEGTVEANLRQPFALRAHRERRFDPRCVGALLERLGRNSAFLEKSHRDLSGGEAQVTALIRALQLDPRVLLLDEPTSSLDRDTAGAVETLLSQWHAEGNGTRTTVWVTHDPDQARRATDRRIIVEGGKIEADILATDETRIEHG